MMDGMKLRAGAVVGAALTMLVAVPAAPAGAEEAPDAIFDRVVADNDLSPAEVEAVVVHVTRSIVKGGVRRARRAIAIGPTVGGSFVDLPESGETSAAVSFGLSLYTFKVPILPDSDLVKEMIKTRFKAKLKEYLKRGVREGKLDISKAEREMIVPQILAEIGREMVGFENLRAKTFERPRFALTLEGDYSLNGGFFSTRLRLGLGVSRLLIAPTLTTYFGDDILFIVGGEMALLALLGKGARSPIVDLFIRAEFPVHGATDAYSFGGGLRVSLDII
jgi:hypothetical protein